MKLRYYTTYTGACQREDRKRRQIVIGRLFKRLKFVPNRAVDTKYRPGRTSTF